MKLYPLYSERNIDDVMKFIVRERYNDVQEVANLPQAFISGRKVGKIPTSISDIADTDRIGDFNYDTDFIYVVVSNAGSAEWRSAPFSNFVSFPSTSGTNGQFLQTNGSGGTSWAFAPIRMLFDHFASVGNSGTSETDLYSDTIAAAQLAANGDKIEVEYGGSFVSSGTATRQVKIYFGGTVIFDTGALTLSLSSAWTAYAAIIRVSGTVIRYMISLATEGAALSAYTAVGELTGLTLANTNVLKITGQAAGAGAATNDIVAKMGTVAFKSAA